MGSSSWVFSLSIEDIPVKNFNDIFEVVKKYLKEIGLEENLIFSIEKKGTIEIIDCSVCAGSNFEDFSKEYLKKELWKFGNILFRFGAVVSEGVDTFLFDRMDFENFL